MSYFRDGPAGGTSLDLERAPVFLRVVIDADGNVDALDQLGDHPAAGESVVVYRYVPGTLAGGIVCSRGRGGGCRPYATAEYAVHANQPSADVSHNSELWRVWCEAQAAAEKPSRHSPQP